MRTGTAHHISETSTLKGNGANVPPPPMKDHAARHNVVRHSSMLLREVSLRGDSIDARWSVTNATLSEVVDGSGV